MRVFTAILALFPIAAAAQYQITGGDISGTGANLQGSVTGNGFAGTIFGYPEPLFSGALNNFHGGDLDFSMAFSPPPGRDWGAYLAISGPSDLAQQGLVPVHYAGPYSPYIQESGGIVTPLLDITGAGIFSVPFTLSAELGYGLPNTSVPKEYVDFMGTGTVTVDVQAPSCANGICGPLSISQVDYKFTQTPELDPAYIGNAMAILAGSLMVFRGRRRRAG
jgi:hypothetical protein